MKNKALTVTIVIPFYNEEHHLKACLDAIAAQTVMPAEVIVVDNNSTDNSIQIAQKYPFVRLLKEKKQGVAYARDKGFNAVRTPLIGRIDADTIVPPDWVAQVGALFTRWPDIAAFSGSTGFHDLPGPAVTLWITKVIRTILFHAGKRDSRYLFGSNMALRTGSWKRVASDVCHTPGTHEDNDLAIHLEKNNLRVHYTNKLVAFISVRRAAATPRQAWRYAFSEYRTFREHGITSIRAWIAGVILLVVYPGLKLSYRAYDPINKRLSWHKLTSRPSIARPHPME